MQTLTAGIVNLVPEGLILLISLTAAVSAFKMAQRGVLAQQLNAVESLASVDVLCTDKTGTLTEPNAARRRAGARRAASDERDAGARRSRATPPARRRATRRCRRSPTRRWRRSSGGRSSGRCRSPRGGAGARSTSATSGSCSARPERFAAADPALAERGAGRGRRRPARARARPRRGAAADRRARRRSSRRTCSPWAWSSSPSGCGRTRPRRSPSSPPQNVALKVLSGDAPATAGAIARDAGVPGRPGARRRGAPLRSGGAARGGAGGARRRSDLAGGQACRRRGAGRCRPLRGDGRRRRQRRPGAQGRRGSRSPRDPACRWPARWPISCSCAATSPSCPGMVAEGRQILRNIQRVAQLFVTKSVFTAVLGLAVAIPTATYPAAAAPVHARLHRHDRHPGVRARAGPQHGPVAARALPAVGGPVRDPGRSGGRASASSPATCSRATASISTCVHSRTVATGIVVFCGLAVVMRLEGEPGRRAPRRRRALRPDGAALRARPGRPFLRDFYELATPTARRSPPGRSASHSGSAECSGRSDCCVCEAPSLTDPVHWPLAGPIRLVA